MDCFDLGLSTDNLNQYLLPIKRKNSNIQHHSTAAFDTSSCEIFKGF